MARTWRDIPEYSNEEGHTVTVRDKDNHGFLYSKPKEHRKQNIRQRRREENQRLRDFVNHHRRAVTSEYPGDSVTIWDAERMVLPQPKQYREYYW